MSSLHGASVVNPSTIIMILSGISRFLNNKVRTCHLELECCRRIIKFKKNSTNDANAKVWSLSAITMTDVFEIPHVKSCN